MTERTPVDEGRRGRRHAWLAILIVGSIVIPRSVAISRAHSECFDDEYHRVRGLAFLGRDLASVDASPATAVNDPSTGEGIVALPMAVANLACGRSPTDPGLYDHRLSPEFFLGLVAAWKALLFLPMAWVAFAWCRSTYGLRSAWLSAGLLAVEPNFAAHIPIAALDVLGVESIAIACFLAWRSFDSTTKARQRAAGVALAAALSIKHTALILPAILAAYAFIRWAWEPWLDRSGWAEWSLDLRPRLVATARTIGVAVVALWAFSLFDVSPSSVRGLESASRGETGAVDAWPAGSYLRAVDEGISHNQGGHMAYLLGERRRGGWWYYFEVVAAYKVPIGVAFVALLAVGSLARDRPRRAEWGLAIPALAYVALATITRINIGFRHFLPAYAFLLLLSTRSLATGGRWITALAWAGVAAAGLHAASFHPDYLSYVNAPWPKPYLAISDSNLDWGQGLKQVRAWLDARPRDGKKVTLAYFGNGRSAPEHYLGGRATVINLESVPPPDDGLLIVSPVFVAGPYDRKGVYARFRSMEPVDVIGHCLLVFDLDRPRE